MRVARARMRSWIGVARFDSLVASGESPGAVTCGTSGLSPADWSGLEGSTAAAAACARLGPMKEDQGMKAGYGSRGSRQGRPAGM